MKKRLMIKSICIGKMEEEMFEKFLLVEIKIIFLIRFIKNIGNMENGINIYLMMVFWKVL